MKNKHISMEIVGLIVTLSIVFLLVFAYLYTEYFYFIIYDDFKAEHTAKIEEYLKNKYSIDTDVTNYVRYYGDEYEAKVIIKDTDFEFYVYEHKYRDASNNIQYELIDDYLECYVCRNVRKKVNSIVKDNWDKSFQEHIVFDAPPGISCLYYSSYLYDKYKDIQIPINYDNPNFDDKFVINIFIYDDISEISKKNISNKIIQAGIKYSEISFTKLDLN